MKWFPDSLCEIESRYASHMQVSQARGGEGEAGRCLGAALHGLRLRWNYMWCPEAKLVKPRARDEAEQNTGL